MSLIRSTKLIGFDPYAYRKDFVERLPAQPAGRVDDLLPHRWAAQGAVGMTSISAAGKMVCPYAYSRSPRH